MKGDRGAQDRIQLRPGQLARDLAERHALEDRGSGIKRDLARYYALLEAELARLPLGPKELAFVGSAVLLAPGGFNDTNFRYLWAHIDDLLRKDPGSFTKAGIDGAELVEALRGLSPGATVALIDSIERAQRAPAVMEAVAPAAARKRSGKRKEQS